MRPAKESRRGAGFNAAAPETTFTDDVVINTGNNPKLTFNQNTSLGLPAQIWEIWGNDDYFTVKDSGNLPFLIYKGAPNYSLHVGSNGNVGMGEPIPTEALHIVRSANPAIRLEQASTGSSMGYLRQ